MEFAAAEAFLFVVGYLVGLLALLVLCVVWRKGLVVLAVYVGVPLAWFVVERHASEQRRLITERYEASEAEAQQRRVEAFGDYCVNRRSTIFRRVNAAPASRGATRNRGLLIRFEEAFPGEPRSLFLADEFAQLSAVSTGCASSNVDYFEDVYNTGGHDEFRRILACRPLKWNVFQQADAQYELVLGEHVTQDPPAGRFDTGHGMMSVSATLRERHGRSVLAESTLYFLNGRTGVGRCPSAQAQAQDLVVEVFGVPPGQ